MASLGKWQDESEVFGSSYLSCWWASSLAWNAAWSSSSDKPAWALPGRSLCSQWTAQSEPIECVWIHRDAGPNAIRFACMAVQRLLQQEHWAKYRAATFLCEGEPALNRQSISIQSLCSLKHLMSQTAERESQLTFEYTAAFLRPFTRLYIEFFQSADRYVIAAHVRDISAALDSSWAAWHSRLRFPTDDSEFCRIGNLWRWHHWCMNKAWVSHS